MIRAAILAGTVWVGGQSMAVPVFFAQAATGDTPTLAGLLLSALAGSPVALILAWVVTRNEKSHKEQRDLWEKEKAELRAEVQREREENRRLNERAVGSAKEMTTMLERTAATLSGVKEGMDASQQRTFRELQEIIQEYSRGRGRDS